MEKITMTRPQGTCTIAAANRMLHGLATIERIELDGGVEVYSATLNNQHIIRHKNNTELVIKVVDYAIEHRLQRVFLGVLP
jgi:hypothetical protein